MDKIQQFAQLLEQQQIEAMKQKNYHNILIEPHPYHSKVVPGRKYTKVDFGRSGKYMIENATGDIYGIKAYGVIHKGHRFGNLDTINQWYWGEYTARKIA